MLPHSRQPRAAALHPVDRAPRSLHDHEPPAQAQEASPAVRRQRTRLLRELRQAGLGDTEAQAEASRLLAGDIWGG
ncbi:hypothetical protein SA2016_4115 (plasmid) [Sinomonas atrocyanea]|uniref:Uncharacterized protein n=1 Tax=Sinomonas atrocyanea TaxID=37927 RepID=A0A127A6K0_9MICC|nr:hypothetical protein [Sinomonas atrocyanea]AMM34767.1 hypothetical protein SA2016_4115 [Sinomonas atrocyanea]